MIFKFQKTGFNSFPPKNAILLIGSSSFHYVERCTDYFPVIQLLTGIWRLYFIRSIRYANDIIFPYEPKQIVIYCGENDLASSDSVTAEMVVDRFIQLFEVIRRKLKHLLLIYL
jgi:hypothetical protein